MTGGSTASESRQEAPLQNRDKSEREALRSLFGPGKDCPPVEQLARTLTGSADDSVRSQMAAHVETCGYCRSELELYKIFQAGEIEPNEASAVSEISKRLRAGSPTTFGRDRDKMIVAVPWWRTIFATSWFTPTMLTAAGVLVAVAVGLQFRHGAPPSLHPLNEDAQPVMRSTAVVVIAPVGDLHATPARIEWRSVSGAVKYRVRLLEVDGNEFWTAEAVAAYIDLPAAVQALIVPAKSVLCEVSAFSQSGARIAQSERVRFRVLQNLYAH